MLANLRNFAVVIGRQAAVILHWLLAIIIIPISLVYLVFLSVVMSFVYIWPWVVHAIFIVAIIIHSVVLAASGDAGMFQRFGSLLVAAAIFFYPIQISAEKKLRTKMENEHNRLKRFVPVSEGDHEIEMFARFGFTTLALIINRKHYRSVDMFLAAIGTVQWGFGDLFVLWIHSQA